MRNETEPDANEFFNARRYFMELTGAFLVYAIVLVLSVTFLKTVEPGFVKLCVAIAPAFPLILVFWAIIRQYKRSDELQKRMALEAFSLGAMIFVLIVAFWGFAENGGAPDLPTIWVAPVLIGLWGMMTPLVMRRYK